MSKLFSLLKATMSEGTQLFGYHSKTTRSRWTMPILLAILMGAIMFFGASSILIGLGEAGAASAILPLYTLITVVVIITEGVYKSGDLLFKPRDNDMLLAMPIKKTTIVFMRIIKFYLFEMLYCLIFLLPAIVAYAMNVKVEASYYLVAITMLVLIPVVPIAISCIAGLVISTVAAKFKRKSFLQIILSFAILTAFAVMILTSITSDFNGHSIITLSNKITKFYCPASTFVDLVANFNVWQYLMFVIVNLAIVAITVFVISKFYFQIVNRVNMVKQTGLTEIKNNFTKHGQTFAIVKKELIKYFNTPVLLTNTAVGLVLFMVAVGALCIKYDDILSSLTSSVKDFPLTVDEIYSHLPSVAFAMVAFASLMTFITATMISLEGRAFDLLKSMPISGKKVIMAKVLAAMLLTVPVTALGAIIMSVRFQFNILDIVLVLTAVVAIPLVTELIGILIDLKYARFNAESDAVVVKQSAGVLIATFLGLGMVLITISLAFAIVFIAGQTAGLIIMDAIFIIVAAFLCLVVATRGEENYMKLAA